MRDLVVVGGGPVGLATALHAARAGLDVVVREPRDGQVDKACGEGLMPGALRSLDALGVHPEGHPISGIRYVAGRRSVDADFRHGPGRGVRRTTLHTALADAVADAGVPVEHRRVEAIVQHSDRVLVDGEPTRYLIGADGLHSSVRHLTGLDSRTRSTAGPTSRPSSRPTRRSSSRFGLRCHLDVAPWTSYVEVHWARDGEAYVTPVTDGRIGVAVLSSSPAPFAELLARFPALQDRLGGLATSRVRGAGPLRQRATRRVAGRVLLAGDAAGYVDALTGEGIAAGLAQAEAAVRAIAGGEPATYERQWRRLMWRHDLLTRGLLALTSPRPLRPLLVPAASAAPWAFSAAVNQLATPA